MGNSDTFALYIHYGGSFGNTGKHVVYTGGNFVGRFGFDEDKFGFFDLKGEIEELGYTFWNGLFFKLPNSEVYTKLNDDTDVMRMLAHLSFKCKALNVYVDNGKKINEMDESEIGQHHVNRVAEGVDNLSHLGDLTQANVNETENVGTLEGDRGVNHFEKYLEEQWSLEDDSDYIPTEDELTGDSLDDTELASDDDEYVTSRRNSKGGAIPKEVFDTYVGVGHVGGLQLVLKGDGDKAVSEYEDSHDDVNSSSTEDEFEDVKKKRKKIVYDYRCVHKDLNVVLGMRFESGYQARAALTTSAIENGRHLCFKRTSMTQMEANCTPPCKWRCYGSRVKGTENFIINRVEGEHDCPRMMRNKLVTSNWLAEQYLNMFRVKPNMSIVDLKRDIMDRYSVYVTKWRLYSCREKAAKALKGTIEEHYGSIRRYIAELLRVDKEGRFELLLGEGTVFRGIYIGFSALKKGFMKGCRPIIGLDGAFLKTYLGGVLLCAICKDGNNQMFPIAWAVAEIENEDNWSWFLKIFMDELGMTDGAGWTFISDQQKGLINAISNLAPFAEHMNCARHVYCNWKKQHKGPTLKNLFWRACRSTCLEEYQLALDALKQEDESAYEDYIERGPQKFCKAFLSIHPRSDMIDNNVSETFNGYIVNARGKHVIDMLEEIRRSLMERQVEKANVVGNLNDTLCPIVRNKLEKLKYCSRKCITHPALGGKFEVDLFDDKHVVVVERNTCSCRVWDLTGIPCVHAISAIMFLKKDPAAFVHEYYSVSRYLEAYNYALEPVRGKNMWPQAEGYTVQPPMMKKMPGRPKKKRRRDPDERNPKNPNKLRKNGVEMTCQKCQQTGHNSRTCKNELVEKPPKEQNKRGRPSKPKPQGTIMEKPKRGRPAKGLGVAKEKAVVDKGKEKAVAIKES